MKTVLAIIAVSSTTVLAAPLAPVADNGFVSEAHKQFVGKVVFAKTADAVSTPEKTADFASKFALSDSIFLRAYLPRSIQNAFRAEGVQCVRDEAFRVWDIAIDGQSVSDANAHLYQEPAPEGTPIYSKSTSVRFDQPLNAKGDVSEQSLWRAFGDRVLPKLTAGTHTVEVTVTATCTAKAEGYPRVWLAAPLATGNFEIAISDRALTGAAGALGTQLPKPALKNAKLEKEMLAIMKRKWAQDEVYRLVIVEKDWTIRHHEVTKLATERVIGTMLTSKGDDGKCRMFPVTFVQASLDGHAKWGATDYNSVGDAVEMTCDNAKK